MLTDADCRHAACPDGLKRRRLTDDSGLYLEVSPAGSKRWFWKFYPDGKESRLVLGSYLDVTLKAARLARDDARRTKASGTNPVQKRRAERMVKATAAANTFDTVAAEFYAQERAGWSDTYAKKWHRRVERDLSPWPGTLPLADISPNSTAMMMNIGMMLVVREARAFKLARSRSCT
jgi:hypothetical protein